MVVEAREAATGQHSPDAASWFLCRIPDTVDAGDMRGNDQSEQHTPDAHSHRVRVAVLVGREACRQDTARFHQIVGERSLPQIPPFARLVPTAATHRSQQQGRRKSAEEEAVFEPEQIQYDAWE